MKKIFMFIFSILLLSSVVSASYPIPHSERDFSLKYFLNHLGAFTTVGGATCTTYPSITGFIDQANLQSVGVFCPTYINPTTGNLCSGSSCTGYTKNLGCSIDAWGSNGYIGQITLAPDSKYNWPTSASQNGVSYEIYTCSDVSVRCGSETFGAQCGEDECSDNEILVTRTCDPHTGSWERTCVARDACTGGTTQAPDKGNTVPPQPVVSSEGVSTSFGKVSIAMIGIAAIVILGAFYYWKKR